MTEFTLARLKEMLILSVIWPPETIYTVNWNDIKCINMHVGYMKSQNMEREQSTTTTFKLSQFPYLYVFETVNYEISPI